MPTTETTTAPQPESITGARFKFFSNTVKAYVQKNADTGDEEMIIEGIASSNARDRYGDTMSAQCQASMLTQANKLTMFGNHDYDVPEDVFGKCIDAKLETAGDTIDLAIRMQIAKSNPRAVQSWKLINEDEIQLAFSIGGRILDADIDEENDDGSGWFPPLIINDLELLEISLVGIPANPRSYTRSFLEDIKRSLTKGAKRDVGVQKAFLRSLGLKSVDEEFPELRDAEAVNEQLAAAPTTEEATATETPAVETPAVETPVDPNPEPPAIAASAADVVTTQASVDELTTQRDALGNDIKELSDQRDALAREVADLEQRAQELKATPVGRSVVATPTGSTHTAAAGNVDLRKLTPEQLRAHTQRVFSGQSGEVLDARATLA